ncbi:hypothetical protein [Pseudoalteromonas sp. R3]|uniref:hypothetical protein n=1 Tax=Pseudoalteromonas sp. R3 TaxID=1709477 RepID=UPI00267A8452
MKTYTSFSKQTAMGALVFSALSYSELAVSHGYMDFPMARQAICEDQGGIGGQKMVPIFPMQHVAQLTWSLVMSSLFRSMSLRLIHPIITTNKRLKKTFQMAPCVQQVRTKNAV